MPSVFYDQRIGNLFIGPICDHPFPAHVHDPAEIVCLTRGQMEMTIAGTRFTIGAGDIAIAFPSVRHSFESVSADADGLSLIFLPETITQFTGSLRTRLPVLPVLRKNELPPEMEGIISHLIDLSPQEGSPLRLGYLHLFLSYIFSLLTLHPASEQMQSGLSYQALHYISEHYTEPLSLESTARALGISRTHLSHIFSQQLRIGFREYINALRIDRACTLLRDPFYSISQISYLCGYGNPRTFHRAFMAHRSVTPNRFRTQLFGESLSESDDPEQSP